MKETEAQLISRMRAMFYWDDVVDKLNYILRPLRVTFSWAEPLGDEARSIILTGTVENVEQATTLISDDKFLSPILTASSASADLQMIHEQRLADILAEHDATLCKSCGHEIGFGDIAWNNGTTDSGYGTPYAVVEIQCLVCDTEIVYIQSWYPHIEHTDELLSVLEQDWD